MADSVDSYGKRLSLQVAAAALSLISEGVAVHANSREVKLSRISGTVYVKRIGNSAVALISSSYPGNEKNVISVAMDNARKLLNEEASVYAECWSEEH